MSGSHRMAWRAHQLKKKASPWRKPMSLHGSGICGGGGDAVGRVQRGEEGEPVFFPHEEAEERRRLLSPVVVGAEAAGEEAGLVVVEDDAAPALADGGGAREGRR